MGLEVDEFAITTVIDSLCLKSVETIRGMLCFFLALCDWSPF